MSEITDESVDVMITSPPYNINIKYGNKWENRKIIKSKSVKYDDNLQESEYRKMLEKSYISN